ncbi:MAG: MBL fold metallo-hydrolase [Chloroflexi bacterium]|nr:MBL fold metallo-hydrolase [Chloroflexota bacterium]
MHKLAGNTYVESSYSGVTVGAVVTKAGIVCIDTPTRPTDARAWGAKLGALSPKPILFVINTDHHRDRVLGNQWFDAPVIAHDWVGERMRLYPDLFRSGGFDTSMDYELLRELSGARIVPPQVTFAEEITILKGDREIVVRHMPGVSPGASWVLLPETGVVFTGDSVVLGAHPRLADADFESWLAGLDELRKAKFPAKTIVPGRGKIIDKAGVKYTQDYLKLARRKMEALLKGSRSRMEAAAVAAELLKQFPAHDRHREAVARRLRADIETWYDAQKGGIE